MDFYTNMLGKCIYLSGDRGQTCIPVNAVFNPRDT